MIWSNNYAVSFAGVLPPQGGGTRVGWDTSTHGEALKCPRTARSFFVPPVRPLDAFDTGVCARAPVETRSRGGTPGTKSEPSVARRYRPATTGRVSHPSSSGSGTPGQVSHPPGGCPK